MFQKILDLSAMTKHQMSPKSLPLLSHPVKPVARGSDTNLHRGISPGLERLPTEVHPSHLVGGHGQQLLLLGLGEAHHEVGEAVPLLRPP